MFLQSMKSFQSPLLIISILSLSIISCVPSRLHDDLKAAHMKCEEENSRLKTGLLEEKTKREELEFDVKDLRRDVNYLKTDTSTLGSSNRRLTSLYAELSTSYDKLI